MVATYTTGYGPDIAKNVATADRRSDIERVSGDGQNREVVQYEGAAVTIALGADELTVLSAYAASARWPCGFPVYQRGAGADGLFIVLQGCIVLRTRLKGGRAFVPRVCSNGEIFGAEGLAAGAVYQTDARADGETVTLHLSRSRMRTLLCEKAPMAVSLVEQVGVAHGQLLERLRELSMLSVEQRLMVAVERTRALRPASDDGQPLVLDAAGYRLLCEMVGATRESVSLALGRLMSDGLAERDGDRVVISAVGNCAVDSDATDDDASGEPSDNDRPVRRRRRSGDRRASQPS